MLGRYAWLDGLRPLGGRSGRLPARVSTAAVVAMVAATSGCYAHFGPLSDPIGATVPVGAQLVDAGHQIDFVAPEAGTIYWIDSCRSMAAAFPERDRTRRLAAGARFALGSSNASLLYFKPDAPDNGGAAESGDQP